MEPDSEICGNNLVAILEGLSEPLCAWSNIIFRQS